MSKFIISLRNSDGKMLEAISFKDAKEALSAFEMLGENIVFEDEYLFAELSYKILNCPPMHLTQKILSSQKE